MLIGVLIEVSECAKKEAYESRILQALYDFRGKCRGNLEIPESRGCFVVERSFCHDCGDCRAASVQEKTQVCDGKRLVFLSSVVTPVSLFVYKHDVLRDLL